MTPTIFDAVQGAERRFRSADTTDADRVAFYQRDLATLFEALRMYDGLVATQKQQIAALNAEVDRLRNRKSADAETIDDLQAGIRRNMAELIRRGVNPADAIRNGVPSADEIAGRAPFKPRIVK